MYIEIKNLVKRIKGVTVLNDINMHLESGKIYGLQGKNGCGKTMLMRAICGLILPTTGEINVDGKVLGKDLSFPQKIGILIENPAFISKYTGFKNLKILALINNTIGDEEINQTLTAVGLDCKDTRTYRKYSLGMKQRLGIACAMMEKPNIILLDEPFNALDESGIELVKNLLVKAKAQGAIIVIACHDKQELEILSDEIYTLADGTVINSIVYSQQEEQSHA